MKAGDLVTYAGFSDVFGIGEDPPRAYGLVIDESNGYVTIRWNDGRVTVVNGRSLVSDSIHDVFAS